MLFDTFDRNGNAEFPFPKVVVYRSVYAAITNIKGMSIEHHDSLACTLNVTTAVSAFSWGEKVGISVSSQSAGSSLVSIQSGVKTILGSATSHGKHRKNIQQILNEASRLLSEHGQCWIVEMSELIDSTSGQFAGTESRDEMECPSCAEPILRKARICKHCKQDVSDQTVNDSEMMNPSLNPPRKKIGYTCNCGKQFRIKIEYVGKRARCPSCKTVFRVPNL